MFMLISNFISLNFLKRMLTLKKKLISLAKYEFHSFIYKCLILKVIRTINKQVKSWINDLNDFLTVNIKVAHVCSFKLKCRKTHLITIMVTNHPKIYISFSLLQEKFQYMFYFLLMWLNTKHLYHLYSQQLRMRIEYFLKC